MDHQPAHFASGETLRYLANRCDERTRAAQWARTPYGRTPQASAEQVKEKVQAALQRQATADTKSIHIETSGGKVTLTGNASSWQTIEDAANAAWAAPGVTEVIDRVKMSMTH